MVYQGIDGVWANSVPRWDVYVKRNHPVETIPRTPPHRADPWQPPLFYLRSCHQMPRLYLTGLAFHAKRS